MKNILSDSGIALEAEVLLGRTLTWQSQLGLGVKPSNGPASGAVYYGGGSENDIVLLACTQEPCAVLWVPFGPVPTYCLVYMSGNIYFLIVSLKERYLKFSCPLSPHSSENKHRWSLAVWWAGEGLVQWAAGQGFGRPLEGREEEEGQLWPASEWLRWLFLFCTWINLNFVLCWWRFIYFCFMWMSVLHMCMRGGWKMMSDLLEWELQSAVICLVGAGNWTKGSWASARNCWVPSPSLQFMPHPFLRQCLTI